MQTVELLFAVTALSLAALLNGFVVLYLVLRTLKAFVWRASPRPATARRHFTLAHR